MNHKKSILEHVSATISRGVCRCVLGLAMVLLNVSSPAQSNMTEVVAAANAFLTTLDPAQSNAVVYAPTLANAGNWSNFPDYEATRNGLIFTSLDSTQRTAALNIAYAALSGAGTNFYEEIRLMDEYLRVNVNTNNYSSNKYYIAFVGAPSTNAPWLLQLCGHHVSYNITYNAAYLSATPMFLGSEPNSYTNDNVVHMPLTVQFNTIFALRQSLTSAAQLAGTYTEVVFGVTPQTGHDDAFPKNYPTTGRGQLYSALTTNQQALVRTLIEAYVNLLPGDTAASLLADYESIPALAQTYVGYAGSTNLGTLGSYFRVDGPRVWIEFSARMGVAFPNIPHWHSVWRDKLTDYGAAFGTSTISTPNRLPVITNQPASQAIELGSNVNFSVAATGAGTLSHQWYKNAAAIPDATNTSYSIATVVATNAGDYFVKVGNFMGYRTSAVATLSTIGNTPPTLDPIPDRALNPGQFLSLTNTATDPDLPAQSLLFSLLTAPTNATLDPASGVVAWRPLIAQADSTNEFSLSVTDSGSPNLGATQSFNVIVAAAVAPSNSAAAYADGTFAMLVSGMVGPDYVIQASTNLLNWETLDTTNPAVMPLNWMDVKASNYPARYFRVLLGP